MTTHKLERIYWGDVTNSTTYLYGSKISYFGKSFIFENKTVASGKVLKTWFSRTHYQANRKSPELPILYRGKTYRLDAVMTTQPSQRVYFQITYFNRQNEEVGFTILRGDQQTFTFPDNAFTYTISLLNAGCQNLTFSYFDLYAEEETLGSLTLPL